MSNAVIVANSVSGGQLVKRRGSILGYESVLPSSAISGHQELDFYPFSNVLDNKNYTEYAPSVDSGELVIEFNQPALSSIDYCGVFSKNAASCGLIVTLEVYYSSSWVSVGTVSANYDGEPMMIFNEFAFTSNLQRLRIQFTSKPYITSVRLGKAFVFPKRPSKGSQPASTASLDKITNTTGSGNAWGVGYYIFGGNQLIAKMKHIERAEFTAFYKKFQKDVRDGKPMFFYFSDDLPEVTFGIHPPKKLQKPTVDGLHSDVTITIEGYV